MMLRGCAHTLAQARGASSILPLLAFFGDLAVHTFLEQLHTTRIRLHRLSRRARISPRRHAPSQNTKRP